MVSTSAMTTKSAAALENTQKRSDMNTTYTLMRIVGEALLSGSVAVAGLGLATGNAHGDAFGNHQWCPGQPLPQSDTPIAWDMGVCHDWYYQSVRDGAPAPYHLLEGVFPNPCPPFAFLCP